MVNVSEANTCSITVSEPHSGNPSVSEPHTHNVNVTQLSDLHTHSVYLAPIIFRSACTGGAQPLVARARAPVCPSLAMPLMIMHVSKPHP